MHYKYARTENQTSKSRSAVKIVVSFVVLLGAVIVFACFNANDDSGISEYYNNDIDTSSFVNPSVKNNIDLVQWAQMACDNGWGYVYGTFGYPLSEKTLSFKAEQYPKEVGENEEFIREHWLGRRTVDCMGLIKSYMWYNPTDNSITYNADGMPDIGCDALFKEATVKGTIDTIPEIKGIAVWAEGHIGVYIGNGYAIESKSTKEGVKKTEISKRHWTHWFKIPYILYENG